MRYPKADLVVKPKTLRIHLTNITGDGAYDIVNSMLNEILKDNEYVTEEIYVSKKFQIEKNMLFFGGKCTVYKRYLPNVISRLLECSLLANVFSGSSPLLVLGDMPLRCNGPQILFLQNTLMFKKYNFNKYSINIKYKIIRLLFRSNLRFADKIILQSEAMKNDFLSIFPGKASLVHVVLNPAPTWIKAFQAKKNFTKYNPKFGVRLIYPARHYAHKNHKLLSQIEDPDLWPISNLILTIPENLNPNPGVSWIQCKGFLLQKSVVQEYYKADALLFLSQTESLGLPLIESMLVGLPVIAPDLPYVRNICGNEAIYYNSNDIKSLQQAVLELQNRLSTDWSPNWSMQLSRLPKSWREVARTICDLTRL